MRAAVVNMSALPQSFLYFFSNQLDAAGSAWNMVVPGRLQAEWQPFEPERFAHTAPFSSLQVEQMKLKETLQKQADMILLLTDPLKTEEDLQQFLSGIKQPVFIMPVSILYPRVHQSESIGYDTALNEIVNYTLSVADTADSMKYGKPRLFFLQLPEGASIHLTKEVALSTGGFELNQADQHTVQRFRQSLEKHYQEGHTFALAATEESINIAEVQKHLPEYMDLNVNVVTVDSAQCLGPNFTAKDRLLMVRAAQKANEWRSSSLPSSNQVEWFHVTA
ncbi:6-phosphofructokinase [Salibacterium aidingense]|uniref:6-phosphofructokinase n=1 Tax=Salibacterium aidingense TaxID=384933 RepID=UPI0004030290|nr:6-phosphofructokinase [Salibacterium aidingense]